MKDKHALWVVEGDYKDGDGFMPFLDCVNTTRADALETKKTIQVRTVAQLRVVKYVPASELVKLLKDDSYAMMFQSIGQYRSALIKAAGGQQCD